MSTQLLNQQDELKTIVSGWFYNVDFNEIYEDNIVEYLSFVTYTTHPKDLTKEERQYIQHLFQLLFSKHQIKKGYNSKIKLMSPLADPIKYAHFPFIYYTVTWLLHQLGCCYLRYLGYKHIVINNVSFWIYKSQSKQPSILFIHGVSTGLTAYMAFIRRLHYSTRRTLILLDLPYVSMRHCFTINPMATILKSLEELLLKNDLIKQKLTIVGHSYGTCVQAYLIRHGRELLSEKTIFLDPVCFLLYHAIMPYNFLYRHRPRTPNQFMIYAFCSCDLFIANTLQRNFYWYENIIYVKDLKAIQESFVFLSELDDLVPAQLVENYLKTKKDQDQQVNVKIFSKFKHAQFLLSDKAQQEILAALN
ncbi:unnamed protein product [Didymodactylos carnosus]|uniref:AB hydrolase-1 domain-containing protein n=1 Tax=Didymodactylos carnosus TaxID=1234261 RepID=A0A8S2L0M9_9BILA|nr:unnamed protein product [Didymodactylos carnosus]CAF3876336.1 unnamed protein product [Didymodactylos carnosus]